MNDLRRSDAKAFNEMITEDYPDEVFKTVITRRAPIGRLALYGFNKNSELKQALLQYEEFYKELIKRVQSKRHKKYETSSETDYSFPGSR